MIGEQFSKKLETLIGKIIIIITITNNINSCIKKTY